jgi:hypothetical protein
LHPQTLQRPFGVPTRNVVPYGESRGPEDFNEPDGTDGSVGVRRWWRRSNFAPAIWLLRLLWC